MPTTFKRIQHVLESRAANAPGAPGPEVLVGGLEVGRTVITRAGLKIHRYAESLKVIDLTNAGKRGKKVQEMHVTVGTFNRDKVNEVLKAFTIDILPLTFAQAKRHLEEVVAGQKAAGDLDGVRASYFTHRGIDVEPPETRIEVESSFEGGNSVRVEAGPHDFHVRSSYVFQPEGKAPFAQDTSYWSAKKADGAKFFAWAKKNLSKLDGMRMGDLIDVWRRLGVHYDSH